MSLVSVYESPLVYDATYETPVPTLGPHGAIISHTFPISAVKGVNLPFSFDVHNDGTEGQIAFGILNSSGNPGNIVCTYLGNELVVAPDQYYRIHITSPAPNCYHLIKNGLIRFESVGNYLIKLWGMWYENGTWYYSSAEEITKNVVVSTDGEPPGVVIRDCE